MPTPAAFRALEDLLRTRFRGMEHYFVGKISLTPPHTGFIYCGFVDSLTAPVSGRVWRSASYEGLMRLVQADDPDLIPRFNTQSQKRFEL